MMTPEIARLFKNHHRNASQMMTLADRMREDNAELLGMVKDLSREIEQLRAGNDEPKEVEAPPVETPEPYAEGAAYGISGRVE